MWKVLFLLAIVFVLSYDPSTKTIERFVGQPTPPTDKSCQPAHFQAVQFATSPYQCPKETNVMMGAITA
jgi:hypothetical protein